MRRPLVIVKSCHRHLARRTAVRATWFLDLKWPCIFVVGDPPPGVGRWVNEPQIVQFPVSDLFPNIAPKLQAALRWGLQHGYDFFFVCDDDTYVVPDRLEVAGRACIRDYVGCFRSDGGAPYPLPYIQASGMFLSERAARIVADSDCMIDGVPDDIAVGRALFGKVKFTDDARFHPGPVPELDDLRITTHKCLPDTMRRLHKELK